MEPSPSPLYIFINLGIGCKAVCMLGKGSAMRPKLSFHLSDFLLINGVHVNLRMGVFRTVINRKRNHS